MYLYVLDDLLVKCVSFQSAFGYLIVYKLRWYSPQNDKSKRFVWEEVSYLSAWWKQSSEEQHKLMNKLVQSKQLEFIGENMH